MLDKKLFLVRGTAFALGTTMMVLGATAMAADMRGGGHSDDHHGGELAAMNGMPGNASDVTRTVEITMHDNYYTPENLSVHKGETVRFKVRNGGDLVHEFNIGDAATHRAHQSEMMEMMESGVLEPDRINHDKMGHGHGGAAMEHDDPNSVLLEPGQSGEIVWKFGEPTALEFACNVPGHYDAGMMGQFRFK